VSVLHMLRSAEYDSRFAPAAGRFAMTQLYEIAPWAFWRVTPPDLDPVETREWLEAFDALVEAEGPDRATFLLKRLLDRARAKRVKLPPVFNTA
jgi:pyruvate dehydrogenase E1 component